MNRSTGAHGSTMPLVHSSADRRTRLLFFTVLGALVPGFALACACGCGVFDVGTATMILTHPGGMFYVEDDYQNQDQNWVGSHAAPDSNNTDKEIETNFGGDRPRLLLQSQLGAVGEDPVLVADFPHGYRFSGAPDIQSYRHNAIGDIRVLGTYTGFSPDMSTGLSAGLKLATGDWTYPNFDRDTSIGTGTTDLLLGGYHLGTISAEHHLKWFVEALFDRAFNTREGYRPGNETDAAAGVMYDGFQLANSGKLTALLQVIGSDRLHDSGVNADPANSGYHRVLVSPGLEADLGKWRLYADAEFRVYHYANAAPSVATEGTQGQLVAPVLLKFIVSYSF